MASPDPSGLLVWLNPTPLSCRPSSKRCRAWTWCPCPWQTALPTGSLPHQAANEQGSPSLWGQGGLGITCKPSGCWGELWHILLGMVATVSGSSQRWHSQVTSASGQWLGELGAGVGQYFQMLRATQGSRLQVGLLLAGFQGRLEDKHRHLGMPGPQEISHSNAA